jgi:hypothetical protein
LVSSTSLKRRRPARRRDVGVVELPPLIGDSFAQVFVVFGSSRITFTMFTMFIRPLFVTIYGVNIGVNIAEKFTVETFTACGVCARRVNIGSRAISHMFTHMFTA